MPITSPTGPRVVPTSSGTGSPSVGRTTTGFTRKAGSRGAHDSTVSLVGLLWATLRHPFGRHDFIEELDYTLVDGVITDTGLERYCWLCRAKDLST